VAARPVCALDAHDARKHRTVRRKPREPRCRESDEAHLTGRQMIEIRVGLEVAPGGDSGSLVGHERNPKKVVERPVWPSLALQEAQKALTHRGQVLP